MSKAEVIQKLEKSGYRLSEKRLRILEELYAVEQVVDMEGFWMTLRERYQISWATVQTFLQRLHSEGLLLREYGDGRSIIYRVKGSLSHSG